MVFVLPPTIDNHVVLLSIAAAVAIGALFSRRKSSRLATADGRPLRKVPTLPNSLPILGDLLTVSNNEERFHDFMSETSLKYRGDPWRIRVIGQPDMLVVSTPDGFEDVLVTQFPNFPQGDFANLVVSSLFGSSIMTLDGEEWSHQRKAAAKFFTAKALRHCMVKTMHKNVLQLYESLDNSITTGKPIELSELVGQFTLQTFTEIGLGVDLRWIGRNVTNPIEQAMAIASPLAARRYRVPAFWWKLEKLIGIGIEKEMVDARAAVCNWLRSVIDQSVAKMAERQQQEAGAANEETVKSVVELFFEHSREDKSGLRAEDLVDFLLAFVVAAQDTSSLTLSRLFLSLATFPHVEKKLRDEMNTVLPSLGVTKDTYLTTEHIQHLVYLDATVREVLRLYPVVPVIHKEAAEDTVICGDVPVYKGDSVGLATYAMARNPNVWGPDAAEFKPERWIDEKTGSLLSFPSTKFATFSAGPRICIGLKLGLLEVRVVAANLLRRYAFSLAEPNDGDYIVAVTLALKHPLVVNVRRASST